MPCLPFSLGLTWLLYKTIFYNYYLRLIFLVCFPKADYLFKIITVNLNPRKDETKFYLKSLVLIIFKYIVIGEGEGWSTMWALNPNLTTISSMEGSQDFEPHQFSKLLEHLHQHIAQLILDEFH